jgi:serine/threonine-protein kinase
VDPDIAELVREERLLDAARLCSARGDAHEASLLYERACDWASAAAEALRAGESARALELAAEADDEALAGRALALVAVDPAAAEACAQRLARRGRERWAARLLEAGGLAVEAARLWERAGETTKAAALLEGAGEAAAAARALETGLRRDPSAWDVATALGALLARFGKLEAAVRVLQRVPSDVPLRREALATLVPALERLGLARAAADAASELASRGGPPPPEEASPAAPAVRTRLFGRYDVAREVASSPSARVLECVDAVRGERVAVKIFAAWDARGSGRDALARFEREVRTMRALDHPNIVPLRDFVPEGPAIVLAWMAGGTLERTLAAAGALAPARAVEIAGAVLAALGEAHRLGILHRDVKPANVLFDDAGGARLSDFGVAHLGDVSTTATAGVFGTLAYMSPEQREGRPATARSDVFAVGVLLREMLTGERPSPAEAPRVLPSQAHRELDERHDAAVARLTAARGAERPADAFEARAALLALPWPATADALGARAVERRSSAWPSAGRLEVRLDGVVVDGWMDRPVERVPLSERALARARCFARADHPALQTVLRVDRDEGAIWLGVPPGRPLDRALLPAERAWLEAALEALHGTGGVHGSVDEAHVVLGEDGPLLRFAPEQEATATVDRDRLALSRL